MTGAPDGDVERALAAMGATPLKYYSFGVMAVRPTESERESLAFAEGPVSGLPPTGEGTQQRYRAHSVAAVFPLLGLALPEAFQIDVEPVWPVGPPVSEQGIMLDRSTAIPTDLNGKFSSRHEATAQANIPGFSPVYASPAFTKDGFAQDGFHHTGLNNVFSQDAVRASPAGYTTPPDGIAEPASDNLPPFVMPAWLDHGRSTDIAPQQPLAPSHASSSLAWLDHLPTSAESGSASHSVAPKSPDTWRPEAREFEPKRPVDPPPVSQTAPPAFSPFTLGNVPPKDSFSAQEQSSDGASVDLKNGSNSLPSWLNEEKLQAVVDVHPRTDDWSLPSLDEHRPHDAWSITPPALPAHPMPDFAPPGVSHRAETSTPPVEEYPSFSAPSHTFAPPPAEAMKHDARLLEDTTPPVLPPSLSSHAGRPPEVASATDGKPALPAPFDLHPVDAASSEPTWHEPPSEPSAWHVTQENHSPISVPADSHSADVTTKNLEPASASWVGSGAEQWGYQWSATGPNNPAMPHSDLPAHVSPTKDAQLQESHASVPAETLPTPPPPVARQASAATRRPLADMFRTLGAGSDHSGTAR